MYVYEWLGGSFPLPQPNEVCGVGEWVQSSMSTVSDWVGHHHYTCIRGWVGHHYCVCTSGCVFHISHRAESSVQSGRVGPKQWC